MSLPEPGPETAWTMISDASRGDRAARDVFVRKYWPLVQGYFAQRWKHSPLGGEIDDAAQEVFLECFRASGPLERADRSQGHAFRAFLHGIVQNVAMRAERKAWKGRALDEGAGVSAEDSRILDESASRQFDRGWARSVLEAAADRLQAAAAGRGAEAVSRVELLRLRFSEGLPIREIAERRGVDAAQLHHEFARARREFKEALEVEIAFHLPGTKDEIESECRRLIALLG